MTTAAVSAFAANFTNIYKGVQSQRAASDFRQHVSMALERQLSNQLASSLISLPAQNGNPALRQQPKPHAPLTASSSVATCSNLTTAREHRKLDRSVSEPVRQIPPNSSRYKTELCRPYEESGNCKYGDKCQFAHGFGELRTLSRHPKYKTELCRTFHSTGFCPYGPRCHFIHNSEDSKKCLLSTLQSNNQPELDICGFSIGSAGELSPTSSLSSSGGSPRSSVSGFFLDENRKLYHEDSLEERSFFIEEGCPQTAPATMTGNVFFSRDYVPLKPLPSLGEDYLSQSLTLEDEVMSSLSNLVSELELDEVLSESGRKSKTEPVDIQKNMIRLPIFSRLSLGSSP